MRLERHDQPAVAGDGAPGLEVAGDLDGMVGVAVVHAHARGLALRLHPASGPAEPLESRPQTVERQAEPQPGGERGEGVEDVVAAGDLEGDPAERGAAVDDRERRRGALEDAGRWRGRRRPPTRPRRTTASPRRSASAARSAAPSSSTQQTTNPSRSIRSRNSANACAVGLLGPPDVEVVGLDVGDDGGVRRVDEEGAVALVGLGDEQVAAPEVGVAPGRAEHPADGVRRVDAAGEQGDGQQRGGRGLAVRAGDGHHPAVEHHRLQAGRARQHQQSAALGLEDLRVVLARRGGDDHGVGVAEVRGGVPEEAGHAELPQGREERACRGRRCRSPGCRGRP